jgi:hypothetical protein
MGNVDYPESSKRTALNQILADLRSVRESLSDPAQRGMVDELFAKIRAKEDDTGTDYAAVGEDVSQFRHSMGDLLFAGFDQAKEKQADGTDPYVVAQKRLLNIAPLARLLQGDLITAAQYEIDEENRVKD